MSWWDDVVRTVFGGGQQQSAPRPKPPTAHTRQREGGGSFQPTTPRQSQPQAAPQQQQSWWGTPVSQPMASGPTPSPDPAPAPEPEQHNNFLADVNRGLMDFITMGGEEGAKEREKNWNNFFGGNWFAQAQARGQQTRDQGGMDAGATIEDMFNGGDFKPHTQAMQDPQFEARPARDLEFTGTSVNGTQQLNEQQWNALSPEQQRGVVANYALWQAVQADKKLGQNVGDVEDAAGYNEAVATIFGEKGGSDIYAPNTLKVLQDLQYSDAETGDLDHFLSGSAISSYDEILNNRQNARADVFAKLAASPVYENENLVGALDRGATLLSAIKQTQVFQPEVAALAGVQSAIDAVPEDRRAGLDNLLKGMADPGVYQTISTDATRNAEFKQIMDNATAGLDPVIVANYFKERYGTLTGAMPQQQFEEYWLKEQ